MHGFQILFHGTFAWDGSVSTAERFAGFYTSRIIAAADQDAAVTRGKELIRAELDETLLREKPSALASLEPEEIQEVELNEGRKLNRRGFTFYKEEEG